MSVIIFANPPFTYGKNLSVEYKVYCKHYHVKNLDACFILKAAQEKLYDGCWIVNSTITETCGEEMDKFIHTAPGAIHVSDIISNGSKSERWMYTSEGFGGNIGITVKSSKMLTNWSDIYRLAPFSKRIEGSCQAQTYSGTISLSDYSECIEVADGDLIVGLRPKDGVLAYKVSKKGFVYNNFVIHHPSAWVMSLLQSRVMTVWIKRTALYDGISYLPKLSKTFYTFPLYQGEDLSHYDSMSDDEIFNELYQKYLKLINK